MGEEQEERVEEEQEDSQEGPKEGNKVEGDKSKGKAKVPISHFFQVSTE